MLIDNYPHYYSIMNNLGSVQFNTLFRDFYLFNYLVEESMSFKTTSRECADHALTSIEAQWQSQGFRLVKKCNEKELLPFEYFKTSHRGTETSFDGPIKWELCRRDE